MVISVKGHPLAIKKGSSFEYISENRLFSGSDAYTLSITFPLKDCPQNIKIFGNINRKDVSLGKVVFDCEIRDKNFYKFGSLTVVEISESEVKCQFLEGRSETNYDTTFDKIYINELNLGSWDILNPENIDPYVAWNPMLRNFVSVALPWVNNNSDSGLPHNFADYDEETMTYSWSESTDSLSWQPFLSYIIKKICEEIGYTYYPGELSSEFIYRYLIICNTLPSSWDIQDYARALPHWTVEEFFSKLELFLGGQFDIDHRNQTISFSFNKSVLKSLPPVYLDKVIEEFSSELSSDESDCEYLECKNIKYKGDDSDSWKYYSCDWFVDERLKNVVRYDTLDKLIEANKGFATWRNTSSRRGTNFNKMLYAADVDTYFIIRTVYGEKVDSDLGDVYEYKCVLQPINQFGERKVNDSENANEEELEFMPVPLDYTEEKYGCCMFLSPGSYSEEKNYYLDIPSEAMSGTQASLLSGTSDSSSEYYDSIYLGFFSGGIISEGKLPYPTTVDVAISDDWGQWWKVPYSFRINDSSSYLASINKIDPKVKKSFKFLSDTIPDVRAVFFIHGKRYICEKLTAIFTENGMSQLLKGVFYPLID